MKKSSKENPVNKTFILYVFVGFGAVCVGLVLMYGMLDYIHNPSHAEPKINFAQQAQDFLNGNRTDLPEGCGFQIFASTGDCILFRQNLLLLKAVGVKQTGLE